MRNLALLFCLEVESSLVGCCLLSLQVLNRLGKLLCNLVNRIPLCLELLGLLLSHRYQGHFFVLILRLSFVFHLFCRCVL